VIEYVSTDRYLGVLVRAGRSFGVDLHYMKSHFYSSLNSIVHRSKNSHDELLVLHLVFSLLQTIGLLVILLTM